MATPTTYNYNIADDTLNGEVNTADLIAEINDEDTDVTPACTNTFTSKTAELVGSPNLTFADANPDTIVRSAGSFVDDGFTVGMVIVITGSASNNGQYTIDSIGGTGDDTLTLIAGDTLTAEGPVAADCKAADLQVTVKDVLSGAEKTTLDGVVAAHEGLISTEAITDPLEGRFEQMVGFLGTAVASSNENNNITSAKKVPIGRICLKVENAFQGDELEVRIQKHDGTSWNDEMDLVDGIELLTNTGVQTRDYDMEGRIELKKHTGNVLNSRRIRVALKPTADVGTRVITGEIGLWQKS